MQEMNMKYLLIILFMLFVSQSLSIELRFTTWSRKNHATKVAANFAFDPPISLELKHGSEYIQTDVELNVVSKGTTTNTIYRMCTPTFVLQGGYGTFRGSICDYPSEPVVLQFSFNSTYENITTTYTADSNPITVTNEIHLAYFRPKNDEKLLNDQIEDLLTYAVKSLNSRLYGGYPRGTPLPDRKVIMDTYRYDSSDMSDAMKQYINMRRKMKFDPSKKALAIIGMGSNVVSQLLLPAATKDKLAVTSFRKDVSEEFSNKETYPYFNRLHLSVDVFLDNIFLYLKKRMWTSLAVIYTNTDDFYGVLWSSYAEKYGINLMKYEIAGSIRSGEEVNYDSVFDSITGSGYRMIMTTAKGEVLKSLIKQADAKKITSLTGYQWIGLKNANDLTFLSTHTEDWCLRRNSDGKLEYCGRTFKGMIIIDNVYDYHYDSTESEFIWRKFLAGDQLRSIAPRSFVFPSEFPSRGVQFALAYDALKTNLLAMQRLIYKRETINGESLSEEIRNNTNFVGMSGKVEFDSNGERNKFLGSISTLWPVEEYLQEKMNMSLRADWISRSQSNWINPILFERKAGSNSFVEKHVMSAYTRLLWKNVPNAEFNGMYRAHIPEDDWAPKDKRYAMNGIKFTKCKGDYDDEYHRLVVRPGKDANENAELFPEMLYKCEEETQHIIIIAPYYCEKGCGGSSLITDINNYTNGYCERQDECRCKPGWVGKDCSTAICYGEKGCGGYGKCVAPDVCQCDSGYDGRRCGIPICEECGIVNSLNCTATDDEPDKCRKGAQCKKAEDCKCNEDHYGRTCTKKCTCKIENAISCNLLNGLCSACKPGYFSNNCEYRYSVFIGIILPSVIAILLLIFLIIKTVTDKMRLKKALSSNDWIVNWDEVKIADKATSQKSSMMISAISMNTNKNTAMKQFNCATWDGIDVYYQKFAGSSVVLSPNVRLEVKRVRELKHPNLVVLMGCCVEAPNVAILTELQPKGSLEDIFSNEDIRLPWNFRFGLLKGICKGLQFIHKSDVKSHGRLKSSNCLVDNRWSIKLTGFGMNHFRSSPDEDKKEPNYADLLWTAPEILKSGVINLDDVKSGSVENDIYSFGMIMSEFCTRDVPFSEVMLEKEELVYMIAGKGNEDSLEVWDEYLSENNVEPGGPVRPVIKDNEWPSKYESRKMLKQLMDSCWHEKKESRPHTIKECEDILNQIDPQKGELIEHLITMLEMYSSNLENVIAKRTKQLQIESQRTEDLVSRLLPRSVSEKLKQGNPVEPENFEAVTVYFSDIVGFTSIAKASTPFEVVALLNKMYTLFDGISAQFDVYKVETIGDAYMIVSGLPTRNGDEHAAHICTTALHLMSIIGTMKIPHMDDKVLQLRSGIHTGLVVAGVVGLKMPRYCLFGDTVNVASEMESGGKPCRIQISGTTESILQRLGGYSTEYRHTVDIDSYGKLATYWLNGKKGFDEPLPAYEA